MPITDKDIIHLADLSRLQLTDKEIKQTEKELGSILEWVERLQKIDTRKVEMQTMPAKAKGWRADEVVECDYEVRDLILENFPEKKDDLLQVPPVFEKPKK
ncbi:MAG: Asp-tRNA(Asn)/Glu-tRNA(Gln) amidotransferase subunit GatC [Patescibacteria group bacterium]|nr:Asp-tRNA(Asn)/Glu-tRNA(Gln) amidotransferase subunit GatC [Patescibacteria group bacterium]